MNKSLLKFWKEYKLILISGLIGGVYAIIGEVLFLIEKTNFIPPLLIQYVLATIFMLIFISFSAIESVIHSPPVLLIFIINIFIFVLMGAFIGLWIILLKKKKNIFWQITMILISLLVLGLIIFIISVFFILLFQHKWAIL